jgi:hypothetical protein
MDSTRNTEQFSSIGYPNIFAPNTTTVIRVKAGTPVTFAVAADPGGTYKGKQSMGFC